LAGELYFFADENTFGTIDELIVFRIWWAYT